MKPLNPYASITTNFMECQDCKYLDHEDAFGKDDPQYKCPQCDCLEMYWIQKKDVPEGALLVEHGYKIDHEAIDAMQRGFEASGDYHKTIAAPDGTLAVYDCETLP